MKRILIFIIATIAPVIQSSTIAQSANTFKDTLVKDVHLDRENDSLKAQVKIRFKLDSLITNKDSLRQ